MSYVLSSVIMNTNNSLKTQFVVLSEEGSVITRNSSTTRWDSDTNLIRSSFSNTSGNNSTTPARDPVIQFNSDTIRKYHQIPQAKGSVLQD